MSLQEEIIQQLGVKPSIDPQEEIRRSVDFLKRYLKKHPFLKTFVLGISGGQDSTLAGRLAQLAMEEMRAETGDASYQFIAVRLPYGVQADEVALGVTYNEIDDYLEGKQVSPEAQATIEKWWYKGQHKRHLPITVFDHFWE